MKKSKSRKKKSPKKIAPGKKGKIVEQITASFHNWPGVKAVSVATFVDLGYVLG